VQELKTIALVAHDNRKNDLIERVNWNYMALTKHKIVCTGTTGNMVENVLKGNSPKEDSEFEIKKLKSGPLGGDQQLGAMISKGYIDLIIFFCGTR
jgi:methylglyoxal synthase